MGECESLLLSFTNLLISPLILRDHLPRGLFQVLPLREDPKQSGDSDETDYDYDANSLETGIDRREDGYYERDENHGEI